MSPMPGPMDLFAVHYPLNGGSWTGHALNAGTCASANCTRRVSPSEVAYFNCESGINQVVPIIDQMSIGENFDSTLVAARQGAEWAWAELYRDLVGSLVGYLRSRGAADPEDLASETFLNVARNLDGFDGGERAFRSWVFVIAHRRLIDERRARSRRPETVGLPITELPGILGGHVEQEAIDRLSTEDMMDVLEDLTEDQRDVLALRIIADLSLEDTARVLDKKVGAIKALQRRALAALKERIDQARVTL